MMIAAAAAALNRLHDETLGLSELRDQADKNVCPTGNELAMWVSGLCDK